MNKQERISVESEINLIKEMLVEIPEGRVIEKMGLQSRLKRLEEEIETDDIEIVKLKQMSMKEYADYELEQMCKDHDKMVEEGLITY